MKIYNFILPLFIVCNTAFAIPVKEKRAYNGIFGQFCEAAVKRFAKFGQCLEQIPEFQQFSESFWYQAAKKELCGDDVEFQMKFSARKDFLMKTNNNSSNTTSFDAYELLQRPQNDNTSELEAQYLFDIKQELKRQTTSSKIHLQKLMVQDSAIPHLTKTATINQKNATETVTENFQNEITSTVTAIPFSPKVLTVTSMIPTVVGVTKTDNTSDSDSTPSLQANFGKIQCMNLCDVIQSASDDVKECWANISLTVLYGVCEIGCLYYFTE